MAVLLRYWFEFDHEASTAARMMPWVGVTAWNLEDAGRIVSDDLFGGDPLPPTTRIVEDVDVQTLDASHVQNQMSPPNRRGIWYPRGYERK